MVRKRLDKKTIERVLNQIAICPPPFQIIRQNGSTRIEMQGSPTEIGINNAELFKYFIDKYHVDTSKAKFKTREITEKVGERDLYLLIEYSRTQREEELQIYASYTA